MTSDDNSVTDRVLEGSAYDEAEVSVRRTFPLQIVAKIRVAVALLASSVVLAPALYISRGRIRSVEEAETVTETLNLTIVSLAFVGVVVTFGAGLLLVRQLYAVHRRSLSEDEARRLVRTEDVLMLFVAQGGAFVLIPVAVALIGVFSSDIITAFYQNSITVYQTSETFGVDARLVSTLGGVFAVLLYGSYRTL